MFAWMLVANALAADDEGAVSASFTDDLEIRYWMKDQRLPGYEDRPVFNYVEQVNRFTASVGTGPWTFDAQVDQVALFFNRYYLDDVLTTENTLVTRPFNRYVPGDPFDPLSPLPGDAYANLEKFRAGYTMESGTITLGDSYVAFGRGSALNLNRNVDIDLDSSVQGAKLFWQPGAWDVTLVGGQLNRQQVFQDNPNLEIPPDLRHTMAGLRAERFGLGPANLGGHAVVYNFVQAPGFTSVGEGFATTPDALVGGLTSELVGVGGMDWFLEGDVYYFPDGTDLPSPLGADAAKDPGYSLYLSSAAYPGPFVILVEGKRYYQAERVNALLTPELYEVAVAPTLEYERAITEDSGATLNSNDIWGGRVQIDWAAVPARFIPYVAYAVFYDKDTGALHFNDVPELITHPMLGFEYFQEDGAILFNMGWRHDQREGGEAGADDQVHADLTLQLPLGGRFFGSANLGVEHYSWGINPLQQEDYVESETSLTVNYGSKAAFTWFTDYTRNPLVNTSGNLFPGLFPEFGEGDKPLYGAAEVQYKPSPALTMKAFFGGYKSGIRCAGGQCRQLPGFEGGRLTVTGSF